MKIGIAVTERNRPEVFAKCIAQIVKYAPKDAVIVVVDDASDQPVTVPKGVKLFRFDNNVGIPRAKNKCIEILMDQGCSDLFLFDSDTWPRTDNWWKPYVDNPEPHLMYIFTAFGNQRSGIRTLGRDIKRNLIWYSHFRGCMLYLERRVVETVGGMRLDFGLGGFEHSEYSTRIHNNRLTRYRSQDVLNSSTYIYSADENMEVESTFTDESRTYWYDKNRPLKQKLAYRKDYVDYHEQN